MAASDELTAILGALVPGDGHVYFCRSELADLRAGDWVDLNGQPARIIFEPGQVDYADAPVDLPRIQRRLTSEEIAGIKPVAHSALDVAVRFGSLGRFHPRFTDLDTHVRERLRLDRAPALPRLGATVQTPGGTGILLSVSMRHQSATIRLESGEEVRVPVEELG